MGSLSMALASPTWTIDYIYARSSSEGQAWGGVEGRSNDHSEPVFFLLLFSCFYRSPLLLLLRMVFFFNRGGRGLYFIFSYILFQTSKHAIQFFTLFFFFGGVYMYVRAREIHTCRDTYTRDPLVAVFDSFASSLSVEAPLCNLFWLDVMAHVTP